MFTTDAFGVRHACRPRLVSMTDTSGAGGGGDNGAAAAAAAAQAAQAAQAGAGGAAPSPADAAAAAAAAAGGQGQQQGQGGQQLDTSGWPEEARNAYEIAQRNLAAARKEAGDSRINAKNAAAEEARTKILADLNKVLNPEAAGDAPSVETLTQQLQAGQTAQAEAARELAATKAAWLAGVDPTKADYLQFQLSRDTAYQQLDPTDSEFSAKLGTILAAKVAADSTLKLAGTVQASGVESLGGASSSTGAITQDAFNKMSVQERTQLYLTDKPAYDRLVAGQA